MHDLVHDLAQSVVEENCLIEVHIDVTGIRHFSNAIHAKSLRTCIYPSSYNYYHNPFIPYVFRCYSLRVLRMENLYKLPSSIGDLIHLRYLNLSGGGFKTLPEYLSKLLNLQILNLDNCFYLKKLPNRLKCLKALRHLCLRGCSSLSSLPPEIGELSTLRTVSIYIVGKQRGFLLAELGRLNLKGELHIKHLERVKTVMDAKDANMANKHLTELVLSWDKKEKSQVHKSAEQILEVLQPHLQQLQTLEVKGYPGVQFPKWMANPSLSKLNSVRLEDCEHCLDLPPMGKLPFLKQLRIESMKLVEYMDKETYDAGVAGGYVAMKFLKLEQLPNLILLSKEVGESMFLHLLDLRIAYCPKLALPFLPSLKKLKIIGTCNQDLLCSIHKSRGLESLEFKSNFELTCFPDGMLRDLTSLKILKIKLYTKLKVLPPEIVNLNAIEQLYINYCNSLESLTEQVVEGLHSLKILHIVECCKFNFCASFQYLTSLESLVVRGCPEIEALPEALQHMTSLQSLTLLRLCNLRSLPNWLGNLGLLHSLIILGCFKLMCLPASIQCLRALKNLTISCNFELRKRCEEDKGEDWPKIAHIPNIHIIN